MRSPRPMHRVLGYRSLGSSNVRESPASSPVKYSNADALHRSHCCAERSESRID